MILSAPRQDGVLNLGFIWPDGNSPDTNLINGEKWEQKWGGGPERKQSLSKNPEENKISKYMKISDHYNDQLLLTT